MADALVDAGEVVGLGMRLKGDVVMGLRVRLKGDLVMGLGVEVKLVGEPGAGVEALGETDAGVETPGETDGSVESLGGTDAGVETLRETGLVGGTGVGVVGLAWVKPRSMGRGVVWWRDWWARWSGVVNRDAGRVLGVLPAVWAMVARAWRSASGVVGGARVRRPGSVMTGRPSASNMMLSVVSWPCGRPAR
ncbi:hypothetical protein [Kribbella sp. CA-293567]|uniref:hypothetical protein n=1 Tax=Kribbella sp. CA-293567 TaxID=3002436 RepID=UPI0022DD3660|nr:hypothetical protein [Kribbella sp. CA-293567]WBQ02766.1 hypothetical protein OX958_22590 [Kribbella sp. CA-293567]